MRRGPLFVLWVLVAVICAPYLALDATVQAPLLCLFSLRKAVLR